MAALAEGQSRHSDGASEDWGRRGGTGGGPAPTDIEGPAGGVMNRLRCGRSSDSDGRDLRFAGHGRYNLQGNITRLPPWGKERDFGQARLDRAEGGEPLRTGPGRTMSQDVPLEG